MIRNYKVFGLALVAMLAFGALVAQGASADPLTCEAPTTCYVTGDQDGAAHKLSTPEGTVSCEEASFQGSGAVSSGAVNEITVTPSYPTEKKAGGTNCVAFGFAGTHVTTNGCTYTFTTPTKIKTDEVTWGTEQLHLLCPAGKSIEITPTFFGASVCTQFIGPQTVTSGHVVGTNKASSSPMDITLDITLSGIHYTGTGGACGNGETHKDASLNGNSTVKCYSDEAHTKPVGCTFS